MVRVLGDMEDRILQQAYEAGRDASRNRRALSECPTYSIGEDGRPWRERWRQGWHDGEAEYRRKYPLPAAPAPKAKAVPIRKGRRR